MRQYSIDQVEIGWLGVAFKEGIAQGSVIAEARTTPSWSQKPTGNGRVVRVYNPDRSGTVTILVDQESKLHQRLYRLAQTDRVSRNVVGDMVVRDTSSGQTFVYRNAYISTEPDEARSTESGTFGWIFNFEKKESINPADDQNLIGS